MPVKKICIYTVLTGAYDLPKPSRTRVSGASYFVVTDDPALQMPGYKQIIINSGDDPIKAQRKAKIYPYDLMPGFDVYVYFDASYEVKTNISGLIALFKGGFGVKRHKTRNCIYQEGRKIIELKKATPEAVNEQLSAYRELGIPENYGVQETGILLRDASEQTKALCAAWWAEVERYTHRDQLGLPAAIFKTSIQPVYLRNHIMDSFFRLHPHAVKKVFGSVRPRVWYLRPFASDMNIGGEYNAQCALIPDGDWICIEDRDTMDLHPHSGRQIEDVILQHGDKYDLFGCITNRLGSGTQCYNGEASNDFNLMNHYAIAKDLHEKKYGQVRELNQPIAGMFMLFRKSTWNKVKFDINIIYFDTQFGKKILRAGGKIALMEGVYRFHSYRPWSDDPRLDKKHLTLSHEGVR